MGFNRSTGLVAGGLRRGDIDVAHLRHVLALLVDWSVAIQTRGPPSSGAFLAGMFSLRYYG